MKIKCRRNYSGKLVERMLRNVMAKMHCFSKGSRMSKIVELAVKIKGLKSYEK